MSPRRIPHYTRWPVVEGYCSPASFLPGDRVPVHCASRVDEFSVTVTRVGAERVTFWSTSGMTAPDHPVPDRAAALGCGWPVGFVIPTATDWPSGFYEVRFEGHDDDPSRRASEAFFVLRDPTPRLGALLMLSTNTYAAYNQWGGGCLYTGEHQVSFERPLERGYLRRPAAPFEVKFDGRMANVTETPDPEHRTLLAYQREHRYPMWTNSAGWHNWERRFVRWAEASGRQLSYCINHDLVAHPELLARTGLLLTIGHDEYWSAEMRDVVDTYVDRGGNWLIAAGDTCAWQIRFDESGSGFVCHKDVEHTRDPIVREGGDPARLTTMWADPVLGRPETETIGLSFTRGGYHRVGHVFADGSGAYTVHRPDHWAFDGLELAPGDEFGGRDRVVGYEVDGCALTIGDDGLAVPTHTDGCPDTFEILALAPARLISIDATVCEAPTELWASLDPPGDLELIRTMLFGDGLFGDGPCGDGVDPEPLRSGHAVMGTFSRGAGRVFHCGTADWAYGLDADPVIQRITANVVDRLSST